MTNAIEIKNLGKSYSSNRVLKNLNLTVKKNCVYGLLGINGAGKTTTFSIISGFIKSYEGEFKINGKLSVLPQDARLYSTRTILSQLSFLALLSGTNKDKVKDEVYDVLKKVGLEEKAGYKPNRLSHGMNKRLLTAQALLADPDIIILDEPLSGLDPKNAYEMKQMINSLKKDKTIVISSHILSDIEELCDYIGVIHDGRNVFEGKIDELNQDQNSVVYKLNQELDPLLFKSISQIKSCEIGERNTFIFNFDSNKTSLEEINFLIFDFLKNRKIGILEVRKNKSLENRFLDMLK